MIAELGQFALAFALVTAALQAWAGLAPAAAEMRAKALTRLTDRAAFVQLGLVATAFGALTIVHISDDFSVLNVVANSHSAKPFVYKLSGVWGNHEGSLLLWILVLAGFGAAVAAFASSPPPRFRARVLGVLGLVGVAFGAFILFTSNPFARLSPAPADGADLNPLLQDPGLAIHPPFLYLGYVGFAVAFAFAVAALIEQPEDRDWAAWARPWALTAWAFLTIGIGLGAWWAYAELGWGGFWAWDPVENASLLPWIAGAALIHSLRAVAVRGAFRNWAYLLAILTFSLSIVGTFLVRSGIITSVHAFAVDPTRGVFILAILGVAMGGALTLYSLRTPTAPIAAFATVSRETALLVNNLLLMTILGTIFVGTFYPVFAEITTGKTGLSVGPPYYNMVITPFVLLLLFACGVGSFLPWRRGDLAHAFRPLIAAGGVGAVVLVLMLTVFDPRNAFAAVAIALAAWLAAAAVINLVSRIDPMKAHWRDHLRAIPLSVWGMNLAHFGFAIVAIGAAGAGALRSQEISFMTPGDEMILGGRVVTMVDVVEAPGPNYAAERAIFETGGRTIAAERRFYPVRGLETAEAGIGGGWLGDVYLTVGSRPDERGWPVTVSFFPFARWLWIGTALTALGGFLSVAGHARESVRRRRAAPDETAPASASAPAPAE